MDPKWYSDSPDPELYDGKLQGGKTILEKRHPDGMGKSMGLVEGVS